jgi:hypothetical protein
VSDILPPSVFEATILSSLQLLDEHGLCCCGGASAHCCLGLQSAQNLCKPLWNGLFSNIISSSAWSFFLCSVADFSLSILTGTATSTTMASPAASSSSAGSTVFTSSPATVSLQEIAALAVVDSMSFEELERFQSTVQDKFRVKQFQRPLDAKIRALGEHPFTRQSEAFVRLLKGMKLVMQREAVALLSFTLPATQTQTTVATTSSSALDVGETSVSPLTAPTHGLFLSCIKDDWTKHGVLTEKLDLKVKEADPSRFADFIAELQKVECIYDDLPLGPELLDASMWWNEYNQEKSCDLSSLWSWMKGKGVKTTPASQLEDATSIQETVSSRVQAAKEALAAAESSHKAHQSQKDAAAPTPDLATLRAEVDAAEKAAAALPNLPFSSVHSDSQLLPWQLCEFVRLLFSALPDCDGDKLDEMLELAAEDFEDEADDEEEKEEEGGDKKRQKVE